MIARLNRGGKACIKAAFREANSNRQSRYPEETE